MYYSVQPLRDNYTDILIVEVFITKNILYNILLFRVLLSFMKLERFNYSQSLIEI